MDRLKEYKPYRFYTFVQLWFLGLIVDTGKLSSVNYLSGQGNCRRTSMSDTFHKNVPIREQEKDEERYEQLSFYGNKGNRL